MKRLRVASPLVLTSLLFLAVMPVWSATGKATVGGPKSNAGTSVGGAASANSKARGTVGEATTPPPVANPAPAGKK